jgi:predicted dehydrogenase
MQLRAVVLGAGFAGQGHALALRDAGVDVVGMASRTADVLERVAAQLQIPAHDTDWARMLRASRPDIVAVGTPGGTHVEMITEALNLGCHVYVDKPLAPTAREAQGLYLHAAQRRVRTAYAATYRYPPQALLARELVLAGAIGKVLEVECVSHYNWPRLCSYGWPHQLGQGGGRLNNNFTHKLAIVLHVLGAEVAAAGGETRNDLGKAPVGPRIHDFREFTRTTLTPQEAAEAEWREVDSDWSYTVLCRLRGPWAPDSLTSATFRHSCLQPCRSRDYVAFYGATGVLHIDGACATGSVYLREGGGEWEELPIPRRITDGLPLAADNTQRNWNQLAREFVAAIRGEVEAGFLTFRDGWIFQEVIDAVRAGRALTPIECA